MFYYFECIIFLCLVACNNFKLFISKLNLRKQNYKILVALSKLSKIINALFIFI